MKDFHKKIVFCLANRILRKFLVWDTSQTISGPEFCRTLFWSNPKVLVLKTETGSDFPGNPARYMHRNLRRGGLLKNDLKVLFLSEKCFLVSSWTSYTTLLFRMSYFY